MLMTEAFLLLVLLLNTTSTYKKARHKYIFALHRAVSFVDAISRKFQTREIA
jgi:hypothetical protein